MASYETPSAPEAVHPMLSLAEVEALARRAHAGQTDKAGRPYAEHLAAVATGVRERGGSEEQIAAAWLHDAVEDDALSEAWLADAALAETTKAIVLAVTKRAGEPVEEYTARILATPGALLIKESDLAHNADPARLAVLTHRPRSGWRPSMPVFGPYWASTATTEVPPTPALKAESALGVHTLPGSALPDSTYRTPALTPYGDEPAPPLGAMGRSALSRVCVSDA